MACLACSAPKPHGEWLHALAPDGSDFGSLWPLCSESCVLAVQTWPVETRISAVFGQNGLRAAVHFLGIAQTVRGNPLDRVQATRPVTQGWSGVIPATRCEHAPVSRTTCPDCGYLTWEPALPD